jgi:hypothetical protein
MNGPLRADRNGALKRWPTPQLSSVDFETAQAEGWILGVGPSDTAISAMA